MFIVLLVFALFASIFTASKQALQYADPFFLVGTRMALAGIFMLVFQYFRDRREFKIVPGSFFRIFLLALFNIYLTNVCEFWGLQYLTSFKTCFIYSLSPFISAFFSYLIFSEVMTKKKWIGLIVGFLGFIPILMNQTMQEEATGHIWFFSWAELAVVCACAFSVYGWIVLKQLIRENNYTPFMANGLSMLIGGGLALIHSSFTESWNPLPVREYIPFLECTFFLIIVSNCICYNLYGFLLKRFSATFLAFAGLTTNIFSAIFGWFFHNEEIPLSFYVSLAVVFLGLFVFYQEELNKNTTNRKGSQSTVKDKKSFMFLRHAFMKARTRALSYFNS